MRRIPPLLYIRFVSVDRLKMRTHLPAHFQERYFRHPCKSPLNPPALMNPCADCKRVFTVSNGKKRRSTDVPATPPAFTGKKTSQFQIRHFTTHNQRLGERWEAIRWHDLLAQTAVVQRAVGCKDLSLKFCRARVQAQPSCSVTKRKKKPPTQKLHLHR